MPIHFSGKAVSGPVKRMVTVLDFLQRIDFFSTESGRKNGFSWCKVGPENAAMVIIQFERFIGKGMIVLAW